MNTSGESCLLLLDFLFILISFFIGEKSNFFKIVFISYLLLIILYYKNYKFWLTSLLAIIIFVFSINSFNKNVSGKQGIVLHYFQLLIPFEYSLFLILVTII